MMTMLKGPKKYADTIRDVIQDRVYLKFNPQDTVPDMIKRMQGHGGGAGGVVNASGRFIGLVSEREIVRKAFGNALNLQERLGYLSDQRSSQEMTAWDVMIANPDSLHPDVSIEEALDIIDSYGYRYMPVVDDQGSFFGLVEAQELYQHAQAKSRNVIEVKDSLLSYFMGTEPYGLGAVV